MRNDEKQTWNVRNSISTILYKMFDVSVFLVALKLFLDVKYYAVKFIGHNITDK